MFEYRISKTIEDTVKANSHFEAYLEFRERMSLGYYGLIQAEVELVGEVTEEETSTPGE